MSPFRALPRPAALRDLLLEITAAAVGLLLFLLILAFLLGEGSIRVSTEGGVTQLLLDWSRPFWSSRLGTIFAWDLVLFFIAVWGLRFCPPACSSSCPDGLVRRSLHAAELLLALVLSLILWRVVVGSVWTIAVPGPWSAAGEVLPGGGETALILGILVIGKLRLARRLEDADRRLDSPLLAVCCWHHRKDAIFNLFLLVTLVAAWKGFDPGRLDQLLHFLKITLLGGASCAIVKRVAMALTASDSHSTSTNRGDISC